MLDIISLYGLYFNTSNSNIIAEIENTKSDL